jgi:hypothetical protein
MAPGTRPSSAETGLAPGMGLSGLLTALGFGPLGGVTTAGLSAVPVPERVSVVADGQRVTDNTARPAPPAPPTGASGSSAPAEVEESETRDDAPEGDIAAGTKLQPRPGGAWLALLAVGLLSDVRRRRRDAAVEEES